MKSNLKNAILSLSFGDDMKDIELLKFIENFKENLIDYGVRCPLPTAFCYNENRKNFCNVTMLI